MARSNLPVDPSHHSPRLRKGERGGGEGRGGTRLPRRLRVFLIAAAVGAGRDLQAQASAGADTTLPHDTVTIVAPRLAASGSLATPSDAPLALTPLAVDLIDASALADRGANSLSSAMRGEPSVGDNYNTFGYTEGLQVRGFNLDEMLNYQRDGMPISTHVPVALENKERIEVLKGLAGIAAGAGAPGGLVNYVLKRPTDADLRVVGAEVSEWGSVRAYGDFGGRAGSDGAFGYRLNVAAEKRSPEIDHAWSRRALASGFFDWRLAPGTLLEAEFEHQQVAQISVPGFGLLDVAGLGYGQVLPPPIDPRLNLNSQPWTQPFESTETSGSLHLAQRLAGGWDASAKLAFQHSRTNDRIAFPDGCSAQPVYVYPGLCGNYEVDIYQYISDGERRDANDADAFLHGRVDTGPVEHELRLGVRTLRYLERYPPDQAYNLVGTVNALAPIALPPNPALTTPNAPADVHQTSFYLDDTLRFARRWSLWLGASEIRLSQASSLTDGSRASSISQRFLTPWVALGYQPWDGGLAYASAGSGIDLASVPNRPDLYVNPGQVLPAVRSHQVELGFKQTRADGGRFQAALFQIEKSFFDSLPPADGASLGLGVSGARLQRHRGLELEDTWRAGARLQLRAAATWLQARTVEAIDPAQAGLSVVNVPRLAASLSAAWEPASAPGLAWTNLVNYSGRKPALAGGAVELPASWQWDTALRYRVASAPGAWTWRAGIDNVTDRRYWREAPIAPWQATYLFPAAARTARLGLELAF